VDLDRVEKLLRLFELSRAWELRVEAEGWRVAVRRGTGHGVGPASPLPGRALDASSSAPEPARSNRMISAPLVGIFRQGSVRLAPGDWVEAGSAVGAIESMKILSPVVAETEGRIVEVLVEDGHPVEYGQPLFLVGRGDGLEQEEEES